MCGFCLVLMWALGTSGQQSGDVVLWVEREVAIPYGNITLHGILTLPPSEGPHPALVIITGAADAEGREGVSAWAHVDHAHRFAIQGFACLRYDPPGVGRSGGKRGLDSLETRAEEALAVVQFLQGCSDIDSEQVGLWGVSQGGWVIAMAAARAPEAIAFLIMVSGTTVSVAEQQVYGVEMQSRAAGVTGEDLAKAVLISRLLIDWQIPSPIFQAEDEADLQRLEDGPWAEFAEIVYEEEPLPEGEELARVIAVLEAIDLEPWAGSLYLGEIYIPNLRRIPPGEAEGLMAAAAESLLASPKEYFELVTCPTLALFGEEDLHVPVERSVELLEDYFATSRNEYLAIVVFPAAGHSLNGFMPAYWEAIYVWLDSLQAVWKSEGD